MTRATVQVLRLFVQTMKFVNNLDNFRPKGLFVRVPMVAAKQQG